MLTHADPLFVAAESAHRGSPAGGARHHAATADRPDRHVKTRRRPRRIRWPRWRPIGATVPPPRLSWP